MVYILRKELTHEKIEETYKALSLIFTFENLTEEDVKNALTKKPNPIVTKTDLINTFICVPFVILQ